VTLEAPLFLQAGTYPAEAVRALVAAAFHPGVCGAGELAVTQRGAGANMTVDVAAGTILIPGATSQRGVYLCRSTATASVTIGAAPGAGDSRIDLVVAQVRDAAYSGSDNDWRITVVAGTPDPSPTAPAVPSGALALATVLVEDDTTSITDAAVTDRRRYARPAAAVTSRVVATDLAHGARGERADTQCLECGDARDLQEARVLDGCGGSLGARGGIARQQV